MMKVCLLYIVLKLMPEPEVKSLPVKNVDDVLTRVKIPLCRLMCYIIMLNECRHH